MSRMAKFDKIAIGEISVNFLGPSHTMVAKAKLVSLKNGASYGSSTIHNWSPAVMEKLTELAEMMEAEIERTFFDDGQESSAAKKTSTQQGIGEFLDNDELAPPM